MSDYNFPVAERFSSMSIASPGKQHLKTIPNTRAKASMASGLQSRRTGQVLFEGQSSPGNAPSVHNKMWNDSISRERRIRMRQPVSGKNDANGRFRVFLESPPLTAFSTVSALHSASLLAEEPVGIATPLDVLRLKTRPHVGLFTKKTKQSQRTHLTGKPPGPHWAFITRAPTLPDLPQIEQWLDCTANYNSSSDDVGDFKDDYRGFIHANNMAGRGIRGPSDLLVQNRSIETPPWLNQESPKMRRMLLLKNDFSISKPNRHMQPVRLVASTAMRMRDHPRYLGLDDSLWEVPSLLCSNETEVPHTGAISDSFFEENDRKTIQSPVLEQNSSEINEKLLIDARNLRKRAGKAEDQELRITLYGESARLYTSVLRDDNDPNVGHCVRALYGLGVCFRKQDQFENAIKALQHALVLDPRGLNGSVYNNLAQALTFAGRHDEAMVAHTEALNIIRLNEENTSESYESNPHPSFIASLQKTGLLEIIDKVSDGYKHRNIL